MKLAIVTTHPIQYNAPWFRMLAQSRDVRIKVFYTWEQSNKPAKFDPGFGKTIQWDIPLLDGYEYSFVRNVSEAPGSHHYKGIINPTLIAEIEAWQAGAVLVFGWPFKSHLACLKYFKGKIPVLFRGDSTLLNETDGVKKILRRIFLRYVYSFVDYALYVGTNNKAYFKAHGLKDSQLVFVPHAIDNKRFSTDSIAFEDAAKEWREELSIADNNFVIAYAGKLDRVKNPWYIIKLAESLKGEHYRFLVVGNGPLEQEIKASTNDSRIIFIDFQNQQKMPVVYRLADVLVLSSVSETWGLAINEAIACNVPVITNEKVGCAIDLIEEGVNGVTTKRDEYQPAIEYIKRLELDEEIYAEIETVNRGIAEVYSFEKIVHAITELLAKIRK